MLPRGSKAVYCMCNRYFAALSGKGILSSVVGGLLLGIGVTLAGSVSDFLAKNQIITFNVKA